MEKEKIIQIESMYSQESSSLFMVALTNKGNIFFNSPQSGWKEIPLPELKEISLSEIKT